MSVLATPRKQVYVRAKAKSCICPVRTQRITTLKELAGSTKVIARVQDTLSHPELTIHKDRSYKRN